MTWSPSHAYWVESVAVRTTRPRPVPSNLTLGETAIHPAGDERSLDRRPRQEHALGVAQRQIQMALIVFHSMARKVEQEQIVALPLVVEAGDGFADRRTVLIQEGDDFIEVSNLGRLEHALEFERIDIRSLQAAETGVVVAAVADDEGVLARHCLAVSETDAREDSPESATPDRRHSALL